MQLEEVKEISIILTDAYRNTLDIGPLIAISMRYDPFSFYDINLENRDSIKLLEYLNSSNGSFIIRKNDYIINIHCFPEYENGNIFRINIYGNIIDKIYNLYFLNKTLAGDLLSSVLIKELKEYVSDKQ